MFVQRLNWFLAKETQTAVNLLAAGQLTQTAVLLVVIVTKERVQLWLTVVFLDNNSLSFG